MININKNFVPSGRFALAISGGVDSMAAAHVFKTLGYDFFAIHFNHNQRPQNDAMQMTCERFCCDFKIELRLGKCNLIVNKNVEDGLRKERLSFFSDIGGPVVTAHHLLDCVENYIANAFKGCPEHKPINEFTDFGSFQIHRPLLRNTKRKFQNWIDTKGLAKYIESDESNEDINYRRNWLRKVIIPAVEERVKLEKMVLKKFYL